MAKVGSKGKSKTGVRKTKGGKKAIVTPDTGKALSPFEELDLFFDRLSRNFLERWSLPDIFGERGPGLQLSAPKVDLIDREKEIVVKAAIPGVTKDDIEVTLTDNSLTIRGETRKESKTEEGDYHRQEISYGSFQRTLPLPAEVDGEKAKASFKDGVLELQLPKRKPVSKRKVSIS